MSNFNKNLIYGVAGFAITGAGYALNQLLKKNKQQV